MGQSERRLTSLGRHVAGLQDQAPEARFGRDQGRARLLAAEIGPAARARDPRRAVRRVAQAGALALAAAALVVLRPREAVRFEVGATQAGVVGAWIAAPEAAELPIRFSEGSVLRLAPGGRARVAAVDAHGAEVALERGALDVAVVHRDRTRWTVRVGPYQVRVIGTRFETRWDPVSEQFAVALREGAITVSGPVVGEGREVHAGERLTVSAAWGTLEVGPIVTAGSDAGTAPDAPVGGTRAAPSALEKAPDVAASPPDRQTGVGVAGSSVLPAQPAIHPDARAEPPEAASHLEQAAAPPGWRALALDARYKEALAAAEREGFDGICGAASARDLRALGDTARLGGSSGRAVQAFTALRRRFPGSTEAAEAAFILGRIAQDQSRDYGGAAGWFMRYLSEQPGGAFAADALGRLVEATDKQGDGAGARRAAERYLTAYPSGSHAGYARRVLARADTPSP
jgi:TolA-binding protein